MSAQPTRHVDGSSLNTDGHEGQTGGAPLFVPPLPRSSPTPFAGYPREGERLDDFELVRELGSGAFARVYLARQLSLGRQVALKVSLNRGREAQTLAKLEHPHIVAVFSETVHEPLDLHLLCMQYVAGTTLEAILHALTPIPPDLRDGRALLAALDDRARDEAPLDLAGLRDRERLSDMDHVEAVCWLAGCLAEALSHAHRIGVLHRDIKPANVLVNRYGRPLLADFNVAQSGDDGPSFGGTLPYMSPEHLAAFIREPIGPVDQRSDIYSLGLVIYEIYTGRRAFEMASGSSPREVVREMIEERLAGSPMLARHASAPPSLERVVARCLAPDPQVRYADATELADDLAAVRELHRVRRELPPPRTLTQWAIASPLWYSAVLIPLPHLLATVVNIAYNGTRIPLTEPQQDAFLWIVLGYNSLAYPTLLFAFFRQLMPVFRVWGDLHRGARADAAVVEEMRQKALILPAWLAGLSCLGWLPGGVIFPSILNLAVGKVESLVYLQFMVSFLLSGLIAITYSALLMELLVVRVIYPGLFLDARGLREKARRELRHEEARLAWLQLLAVLIPIAGAALLLGVGPEQFTPASYRAFRVLVTALLAAGMLGLGLAVYTAAEVRDAVGRLTGVGR